jgi:Domain of unknown function (DUF1841)
MTNIDPSTAVGGHTREELRGSYSKAWRKHRAHTPLTPLESMIVEVIERHPQYQTLIEDPQDALAFEPTAADPVENPFLHMGLHLAVREQIAIDRPPGIRELRHSLEARLGDRHGAEHALMEALAETLWEAQRNGRAPDEAHYLELSRRRLRAASTR